MEVLHVVRCLFCGAHSERFETEEELAQHAKENDWHKTVGGDWVCVDCQEAVAMFIEEFT